MRQLRSVLLIDDSRADNIIHARWLHRSGAVASRDDVLVQPNGRAALRFLQQWVDDPGAAAVPFPPPLILVDINMPLMGGFEFLAALQECGITQRLAGTVLLMISSSSAPLDRQRAARFPLVQGYVTKPVTGTVIAKLMDDYFPEPG